MDEHEMFIQQASVLVHVHLSQLQFILQYCPSQVQITCQNTQGLSSNNFFTLPPPLNGLQKGKYARNI